MSTTATKREIRTLLRRVKSLERIVQFVHVHEVKHLTNLLREAVAIEELSSTNGVDGARYARWLRAAKWAIRVKAKNEKKLSSYMNRLTKRQAKAQAMRRLIDTAHEAFATKPPQKGKVQS